MSQSDQAADTVLPEADTAKQSATVWFVRECLFEMVRQFWNVVLEKSGEGQIGEVRYRIRTTKT